MGLFSGKGYEMRHTPYGYDINDGRAVINEEQAANIRQICENYLTGMSFKKAAAMVGLVMSHCGVKQLMLNKRYLGNSFYPAILDEETVLKVKAERIRRETELGRERQEGKRSGPVGIIYTKFTSPKVLRKYEDSIRQAEYAYSLIRNEVSE